MTTEQRFKKAVRSLWARGLYPSPTALNKLLGKSRGPMNNLGGCRPRWRREVMTELGIPLQRRRSRV